MTAPDDFTGKLENVDQGQKVGLIRDVAQNIPLFTDISRAMRLGGIRDRGIIGPSIVIEQNFRNVSEHGTVVALVADTIGNLIGLDPSQRNFLVEGAFLHDVTKKLEISTQVYIRALRSGEQGRAEAERAGIQSIMSNVGISIDIANVFNNAITMDPVALSQLFDSTINTPFLEKILETADIPEPDKVALRNIATSDSFAAMPLAVARADHFANYLTEETAGVVRCRSIAQKMREAQQLPELNGDESDLLGLVLTYADAIVNNSQLVVPGDRKALAIEKNRTLHEAGTSYFGGELFFDASYAAMDVAEQLIAQMAVNHTPTLGERINPADLPRIILNILQERVNTYPKTTGAEV
jgi:hypothetical protein